LVLPIGKRLGTHLCKILGINFLLIPKLMWRCYMVIGCYVWMDVKFLVWLDVTLRTWRPCHQSLFEILNPSLFETSNNISRLGFIASMILFLSSSSWLGLGSWCCVWVLSRVSMWSFEIPSPFYQPFKISHLKHKPFHVVHGLWVGFQLKFLKCHP
jgi:hypothetical protein